MEIKYVFLFVLFPPEFFSLLVLGVAFMAL